MWDVECNKLWRIWRVNIRKCKILNEALFSSTVNQGKTSNVTEKSIGI